MSKVYVLVMAVILAACADDLESAPTYGTATVERASISVSVGSSGIVEPLATVEVKSKASGEVLELLVETGDYVQAGALLARIDPRTVRNRFAQAEAGLKAALSRRQISAAQMLRAEALVKRGTLTEIEHEQAALELANAEAQVVTAQVEVENARIAVDDTEIRAPVAGTIIAKPVEKGQVISSPTQDFAGGTVLLKMADLSAVQIRALVDETDIGKVQPGMLARVTVAAYPRQPFQGKVIKIEPQAVVEQNVTMFAVLIAIQNEDGLLLPGMNSEVEISVAERIDVLSLPVMALRTARDIASTASILGITEADIRKAIAGDEKPSAASVGNRGPGRSKSSAKPDYRFGGEFWVVVRDANGATRIANINAGLTDLDRVEIISGLNAADQVLLLPSAHLFETQQELQQFIERRVGGVPGIG